MGIKTKSNKANLQAYAKQFGMKAWHHTYAWWRAHGYNPETNY